MIYSSIRVVAYSVIALVLLVCGLLIVLYSPWAQNIAREAVLKKMNVSGTSLTLDKFRLHFPLRAEVAGLAMAQDGDTLVAANTADVDIALLPLLAGRVKVNDAALTGVRYRQGSPDSTLYMTVAADSIALSPVTVTLADMSIGLEDGIIRGGRMGLFLKPDTSAPQPPAPPTQMSIALGRLKLNDFTYTMRLMPSIDTLSTQIADAELADGLIDLYNQKVKLGHFSGEYLDARYITPDSASIAAAGPYPESLPTDTATASAPWTVEIGNIAFAHSHAIYALSGTTPMPGLDFSYIEVSDFDLRLRNFFNQATQVRLPLSIRGTERCGVKLAVDGTLDIDSVGLNFKGFNLSTAEGTMASFDGLMGMGDMASDPTLPLALKLDGAFVPADLRMMFPAYSPYLAGIPSAENILLDVDVAGTTGHLDVEELSLRVNRCISLAASGYVENMMRPDELGGSLALRGNIINVSGIKKQFLATDVAKTINVPPMTLNGRVAMQRGAVSGNLLASTAKGDIRLDGRWSSRAEDYKASVTARRFPVEAFMPLLGVGAVSATVDVKGHGYDPFSKAMKADLAANVSSAFYQGVEYTDITLTANIADGKGRLVLNSDNPAADMGIEAYGNLDGNTYTWNATVDGRHIDLYSLKLATEPSSVEIMAKADATIGPGKNDISAHLVLDDLYYTRTGGTIGLTDVEATLNATDTLTDLNVHNRDLRASFSSPSTLDSLATRFGQAASLLSEQIDSYMLNVDTLGRTLPQFVLEVAGGNSNLVNDILAPSKMSVRSFKLSAKNDSILTVDGSAKRFVTGDMRLDSLYLDAHQHGGHLHFGAGLENRPGNLDEWHKVDIIGRVDGTRGGIGLTQQNLKGKTGFQFGLAATASHADSTLTVQVKPAEPIIGYQKWSVNNDNFIKYRIPDGHVDANLRMHGGNSSLALFTEHGTAETDSIHNDVQEDLVVQLTDIHIADWISFNPFAPPLNGDINADMRINRQDKIFVGKGIASVNNLIYGKQKVADFKADFDVAANVSGTINANADLYVDGVKTMTLSGALNDSTATSPLDLDFAMIRFPLATVNPFLPKGTGRVSGMLNGKMKISGTDARPIIDGTIDFDSTAVTLSMTGTDYKFSTTPIVVEKSVVRFDRFAITACNANPLYVDGTVDISDMADMRLNLGLKADNMMIVNSKRAKRGADVYGKALISLDASARGSMQMLRIGADVSIMPGTNVTYVIPDATNAITNKSAGEMVKFVNFTDSLAVLDADSIANKSMALFLDATLNVENGSTINVDLSADGTNKVQVQGNGSLSYTMSPLDNGRMQGRLDIVNGYVRYTPPFMSEKNFAFDDGSYIAFTGDMMNPSLNIRATDVIKANVTQSGQNSRLVNFDVILSVTGTLNRMDVAFDLSTKDDLTVANELESMSPEQRANQAMNMLLYNVYTGPGTKGDASLSGNPLFSFLESQINSWAASNIKGIDLSFGIDQYDRTVGGNTSTTTSYSYQVSKSLFNDRFKIVVGGNYSTDANADENFSQNLINDISFEYFINQQRTMYVRLFRHTGYESILEGEITQTGVGFVYRRKLRRLGDMFLTPGQVRRRDEREARIKTSNDTPLK